MRIKSRGGSATSKTIPRNVELQSRSQARIFPYRERRGVDHAAYGTGIHLDATLGWIELPAGFVRVRVKLDLINRLACCT